MSTFPVLKTVRILLSDVNGEKKSSVFIILSALCYELCSSLMVKVVGDFYDAVLNQSATKFLKVLLFSLVVITAVASFKALKTYFAERSALMWRVSLNSLMLDEIEYCEFISLDNFEQRISQDNERLCIIIAKLVEDGAVAPFVIIYYTYYLWLSFGWVTPLICYTYFLIGFVSSFWLVDGISSIVYRQEFFEGTYRFCIGQYLRDISSISLLKGKELEFETINKKFLSLVSNKDALLYRRLKFHLINNCYDYFGAIGNDDLGL